MGRSVEHLAALLCAAILGASPPAAGAPSPDTTETLAVSGTLKAAQKLFEQGRYAAADTLCRALLARAEQQHGVQSTEAADVLEVLTEVLRMEGQGAKPEVVELGRRAVRIREHALGHTQLSTALFNLGNLMAESGSYPEATQLYERALVIREKAQGPEDPDVADILTGLTTVETYAGDYPSAIKHGERAVAILERGKWATHQKMADALSSLSDPYGNLGDYGRAATLLERAVAIGEKALSPDDASLAWYRNNLASLYYNTGQYAKGRLLYERALASLKHTLGPEHPDIGFTQMLLANLVADQGEYDTARALYESSISLREKAYGPDHPDVANSLYNLATLLTDMGDARAARPLTERSLAIRRKALGPGHPDVAFSLILLARQLHLLGDDAGALRLGRETLAIREKALGPYHQQVAVSLEFLSSIYLTTGQLDSAWAAARRSQAIREKAFGPDHFTMARSLSRQADIMLQRGDPAGARKLQERAVAVMQKSLGLEHVDTVQLLERLAGVVRETPDQAAALAYALQADSLGRIHFTANMQGLSEQQALRYAAVRTIGHHLALSMAVHDSTPATARRVWDHMIPWRGLVLEEMAARHRTTLTSGDSMLTRLSDSLTEARQVLAAAWARGPTGELVNYRATLDSLSRLEERLEAQLARRSAAFRARLVRSRIGFEQIAHALRAGSALVAYARYDPPPRVVVDSTGRARSHEAEDAPGYLAFVLRAGVPSVLPLGRATAIDSLIAAWSAEAARGPAVPGQATGDAIYRARGEALRRAIWDPVASKVGDAPEFFVVPDGTLNLVNLGALPVGKNAYLVETQPLIHVLTTERDLVPDSARAPSGTGLLAVGDPDYDVTPASRFVAATEPAAGGNEPAARGRRSTCGEFRSVRWNRLPETAREVMDLSQLWKTQQLKRGPASNAGQAVVLTGAQAAETEVTSRIAGHRVIHIATHGFFLGADCTSSETAQAMIATPSDLSQTAVTKAEESPGGKARADASVATGEENPLLSSGLVLAGANHHDEAQTGTGDGVLTAEEITSLDCSGVEWAVLSACQTGAGRVTAGEGVFGLRRAFQIAGAKTVIMSLWPVDDQSTRQWMEALYRARLRRGLGTAEAVRAASREILVKRRRSHQSTHPFFWGAFVAAGPAE